MKSMKLFLLVLVIVMLAVLPGVAAQEDAPECDAAGIAAAQAEALAGVTDLEGLREVQAQLASEIAACEGLVFEGDAAVVLGPFDIPEGIYRVVVTTPGFFIAHETVMDGECEFSSIIGLNIMMNQATDGAESLFESKGCRVLLELSNITEPWTMEFQAIE